MFTGLIATIFAVVLNATVFLPIVFGGTVIGEPPTEPKTIVHYEASNIVVDQDGLFTLEANGNIYAGCLPTISYTGSFPEGITPSDCSATSQDQITLFEDGSAIWDLGTGEEIAGCFLADWGCSVDGASASSAGTMKSISFNK